MKGSLYSISRDEGLCNTSMSHTTRCYFVLGLSFRYIHLILGLATETFLAWGSIISYLARTDEFITA
jgi:hypothetical protein